MINNKAAVWNTHPIAPCGDTPVVSVKKETEYSYRFLCAAYNKQHKIHEVRCGIMDVQAALPALGEWDELDVTDIESLVAFYDGNQDKAREALVIAQVALAMSRVALPMSQATLPGEVVWTGDFEACRDFIVRACWGAGARGPEDWYPEEELELRKAQLAYDETMDRYEEYCDWDEEYCDWDEDDDDESFDELPF